jgi:hypothetical protein
MQPVARCAPCTVRCPYVAQTCVTPWESQLPCASPSDAESARSNLAHAQDSWCSTDFSPGFCSSPRAAKRGEPLEAWPALPPPTSPKHALPAKPPTPPSGYFFSPRGSLYSVSPDSTVRAPDTARRLKQYAFGAAQPAQTGAWCARRRPCPARKTRGFRGRPTRG